MTQPLFSCLPQAGFFSKIGIALLLLSAPFVAAQEMRPVGNTGMGFFTKNGKIYDKTGAEFIIRGINHTLWWGDEIHNHEAITSPNGLVKTGANLIRAVFGPGGGADTPAEMRKEVESILAQKLVPMVERHDATGNDTATTDSALQQVVDNVWLVPANVQLLKDYEDRIILNIANEWGPNSSVWRDGYKTAVMKLRRAGINCLLVIDAGGHFGQDYRSIINYGAEIVSSDPQHNIVFSLHTYGFWVSTNRNANLAGTWGPPANDPWLFEDKMTALRQTRLPIIVGEFSWEGSDQVNYKTQDILNYCQANRIGWIAWSWNQNSGDGLSPLDMLGFSNGTSKWLYTTDADLTPYGLLIVKGAGGLQQTSVRPAIFGGGGGPGPDIIPPTAPTGLTASGVTTTGLNLSWTASTDAVGVVGYDVYKNNIILNSSTVPSTNFNVTALTPNTSYAFSIKAKDAAGNQSPASQPLTVMTLPMPTSGLPPPWVSQDIGSTGIAGSASASNSTFSISGSGADIWGTADAFRYVYTPVSGTAELTVRVATQTASNPWAKAGIMIRQSLAANAPFVNLCVTPANGISLQRRTTAGAAADQPANVAGTAPCWLRLTRNGNTFTASRSTDGVVWSQIATTTCTMTDSVVVGLSVTAHTIAATSTAVFEKVDLGVGGGGTGSGNGGGGGTGSIGTKVINFESLPTGLLANPYSDASGFMFAGAYSPADSADPLRINLLNGNKVLINNNWDSKITVSRTGGGAFNLVSLRYGSDPWGGLADATVTGTTATGAAVVATFAGNSATLQTLTLNWSNLTKVVIDFSKGANGSYGMIDDITVAVPAP